MKRNLLFISRYPEIIDEFQGILEEKQIETDIAQNGTDAMELLKQKEYQILVTDLNLDGYNGDKIISYVNQVFPNTICMLYTNSISAVQLGFYLNKRDVFRVFLRPVNFRQEFMQALEEAYELYDLKKHDRDSRHERLKQLEDNRKAIAEIEKIIEKFCLRLIVLLHRGKAAHFLQPFEYFSADIDAVARRCVVHGVVVRVNLIF